MCVAWLACAGLQAQTWPPEGTRLVEQDILLATPGLSIAPVGPTTRLWPGAVIPYVVDADLPQRDLIQTAMNHWSERTPVRFVPNHGEANYVRIQLGPTCAAHIGMVGGEQGVFLAADCPLSNTIHEFGHTIGLWHEQSRQDRDFHIDFHAERLPPSARGQSAQQLHDTADIGPYDYGSIMHYGAGLLNAPLGSHLETKPAGIPVGLPMSISAADIDGVAQLYGMPSGKTTVATHPAGLPMVVDGQSYSSTQAFDWAPGSLHTIEAPDNTDIGGTRYRFAKWSDGGARAHQIEASPEVTIFVANHRILHRLQVDTADAGAGSVTLETSEPGGWAADGSTATLTATPAPGNRFYRWQFPLAARQPYFANPLIRYNRDPVQTTVPPYTAEFTRQPVTTIATSVSGLNLLVDGDPYVSPASFLWIPGSTHTVSVEPAYFDLDKTLRRSFVRWSDGGAREHMVTASPSGGELQAEFSTEYQVMASYPVGLADVVIEPRTAVPPANGYYPAGMHLKFRVLVLSASLAYAGVTGSIETLADEFETDLNYPLQLVVQLVAGAGLRNDGVTEAATFVAGRAVSPGEIVTLFGGGVGPDQPLTLQLDAAGRVTKELGGTQVLFDGVPAPVIYTSNRQVSAVAPFALAGRSNVQVQVVYQGIAGPAEPLDVVSSRPGVFSATGTGRGAGAILNQDQTLNTAANAAARGSIVTLFATGTGAVIPAVEDGTVPLSVLPKPIAPVKVYIAGRLAQVEYAGAAPGLVAGVTQINARVPEHIAPGEQVPVVLQVGDARSPNFLTLAVK